MAAPQCEQNFAPANTMPKQDGQATTARREPQWSQVVAPAGTGAPHAGQFIVCAGAVMFSHLITRKGARCQWCVTVRGWRSAIHYILPLNVYFTEIRFCTMMPRRRQQFYMGLIDYLKTQFLEIIEWQDDSRN